MAAKRPENNWKYFKGSAFFCSPHLEMVRELQNIFLYGLYAGRADQQGKLEFKKKLSVAVPRISEIIELQFGQKTPYILFYILELSKNYCCLIISKKCAVTRKFLFEFPQLLLRPASPHG